MLEPLHIPISMHKTQIPEPRAKPAAALGAVTPAGGQGQGQRSRQALCGHHSRSPACRFPSPEHDPCVPATQPQGPGQAGRSLASWLLAEGFQQGEAQTKSLALPRHCRGTVSRLDLFPVCRGRDLAGGQEGNLAHLCWVSSAWPFPMQSVLPFFKPCHLEADFAGSLSSLARGEGFGSKHGIYPGMNNRQEDRTHRKLLIDRDVIHYQSCAV